MRRDLLKVLRSGSYLTVAARYAGISPQTLWRWLRRGREDRSGAYRDFYVQVQKALAEPEAMAVGIINREMRSNWRAAIAYLERKFPRRWSQRATRFAKDSTERKSLPIAVRLQHDAAFLGEVARVLDEAGALDAVVGDEAGSSMDVGDTPPPDRSAGGVSRDV